MSASIRDAASRLAQWLAALPRLYGRRILPLDDDVALLAGRLADRAVGSGHTPELADALIAATAEHNGLIVLTRNVRDFRPLGIRPIDPFKTIPT